MTRPWDRAVLCEPAGETPYLSPELQLLFKSVNMRPKDHVDANEVIPKLCHDQARLLFDELPVDHDWRDINQLS